MIRPVGLPLKNRVQHEFKSLCEKGGGIQGGPTRGGVQKLLQHYGSLLNKYAYEQSAFHISTFSNSNPWHICFSVGLAWGHLAQLHLDMTEAAVNFLESGNGTWLDHASKFHLERGPDAIRQPLASAFHVFSTIRLPSQVPDSLDGIKNAENRWLGKVLGPPRVPYIGSWNSTALFMVALFSRPHLAQSMLNPVVVLPPGGPVYTALNILQSVHIISEKPDGNDMDDGGWEPGVLYNNNALMAKLIPGMPGLNMVDLHSGLYLLGTNYPHADQWLER